MSIEPMAYMKAHKVGTYIEGVFEWDIELSTTPINEGEPLYTAAQLEAEKKRAVDEALRYYRSLIVNGGLVIHMTYRDGDTVLNGQKLINAAELASTRFGRELATSISADLYEDMARAMKEKNHD